MTKTDDFYQLEKPIIQLKEQIDELLLAGEPGTAEKVSALRLEIEKEWAKIAPHITPTQIVQIARHPKRPYSLDYIAALMTDFMELHGDRRFADDPALVAGFAFYKGRTVAVVGQQKGRTTRERLDRNFGQMNPEGYRKALRIFKLAEKFGHPIVSLIDTQGAYPGIGSEERGQAEAIALNLKTMFTLRVPIVCIVIGEGGSGGALGIGIGDQVMMLEHSFYSVISPEGCAAIIWKDKSDPSIVRQAAENLHLRAQDHFGFGLIDKIIPEPAGGAHIDSETTFKTVDKHLSQALKKLESKPVEELLNERYAKFRKMGVFVEK
ncbi:MAG: acetyl-CoA carboxylase carboxyltransferase subunit alpha [Candidatus Aminicenantes bacterium]|nr:acetyl-CoA carboxylase carboxyltransferase subunit alpha [Candidatus Aminicenantes bacterium]